MSRLTGQSHTRGSPRNAKATGKFAASRPPEAQTARWHSLPYKPNQEAFMSVPAHRVLLTGTPHAITVIPRTAEVSA